MRLLVFCFLFFGFFVCFSLNDFSGIDENVQAKEDDDAKAARLSLTIQASTGTEKMKKKSL